MAKNILVIGNFDVLHPGHIRLLKFAKECGDKLSVAINADNTTKGLGRVDEHHRLEMVQSLQFVDHVFITSLTPNQLVKEYQPWAVVKGKEFEAEDNPEKEALTKYGGKLIFGSGEFDFISDQIQLPIHKIGRSFDYEELADYAKRHKINFDSLQSYFIKIRNLNVGVIGEIIVDEYVQGTAIGLSQEDPTIVMIPSKTDTFLGGAAITAGHLKSIGADKVTLFSVLGADEYAKYTKNNINKYQINHFLFEDESRPTPLKTRYRADKKTLLRVNKVRQHKISLELQDTLFESIKNNIDQFDIFVFSDFNYGVLPQVLVERISHLCKKNNINIIADSQTSSQVGDISRYKNTFLMTPTEKEVRVALNNPDDGLVILAKKLCEKSKPENLVITLASEGVFIHIPTIDGSSWENDKIPAINKNAADPAGAGDCFLATSSLFMAVGATPWQAFYIASIAAAYQVDTIGNTPLLHNVLLNTVKASFD